MMLYMCHTEKVNINIIEKQCSLSILNISILAANEDENHFLEFEYKDQNGDKVNDVKFEVNFDGGSKVEGTILRGFHRIESVPDEGFNLEFVPGDQLEKELVVLRKQLRTELDQSIQQVKAESAMLSKTWDKTAMWKKPFIYAGGGLTGAGQWVVDSVEGIVDIATGIARANMVSYQWLGEYTEHRAKAFAAFASGDEDTLKQEMKQIESMHTQLGENIGDVSESVRTLGLIAWDDETRTMLTEFPMNYFSELHTTEKVRTGFRYGIDFALIFAEGVGAGLLAIKNAGKISRILKNIARVIEKLRLKLKVRKGKVDDNYKFKAKRKTPKPSKQDIELAKTNGSSPEYIAARKKVSQHYMENNGYGEKDIRNALGTDDGKQIGGVDLKKPVEVVSYPPPEYMYQYVNSHGNTGKWFDPIGGQTPDELGINSDGKILKKFKMPKGSGLKSYSNSIVDNWSDPSNPVKTSGGGEQLFVNDEVKNKVISLNKIGG